MTSEASIWTQALAAEGNIVVEVAKVEEPILHYVTTIRVGKNSAITGKSGSRLGSLQKAVDQLGGGTKTKRAPRAKVAEAETVSETPASNEVAEA